MKVRYKTVSQSQCHLAEIGQSVSMLLHRPENLLNGVAGQQHEVQQHQRPENIDLHHFKICASETQQEGKSCTLPHLHLAQLPRQRLIARVLQTNPTLIFCWRPVELLDKDTTIKTLGLIVCPSVILLVPDALGCEVTDEQLKQVEPDEIGNDIQRNRLHSLDVSHHQDASDRPTQLAVCHQPVYQRIVATTNPTDRTRSQHSNINYSNNLFMLRRPPKTFNLIQEIDLKEK